MQGWLYCSHLLNRKLAQRNIPLQGLYSSWVVGDIGSGPLPLNLGGFFFSPVPPWFSDVFPLVPAQHIPLDIYIKINMKFLINFEVGYFSLILMGRNELPWRTRYLIIARRAIGIKNMRARLGTGELLMFKHTENIISSFSGFKVQYEEKMPDCLQGAAVNQPD